MKKLKRLLPIILITGITVLASLVLYRKIIDHEKDRCLVRLSEYAATFNQEISVKFSDEIAKLHMVETMLRSDDNLDEDRIEFLHLDEFQPTTVFSRIDVFYSDGMIISNGSEQSTCDSAEFDALMAEGEHMSRRRTDFITGAECIYYCIPIRCADGDAALLVGVINAETLSAVFVPQLYGGSSNYCVVDSRDGNYIMDSWHSELGNAYETDERKRVKGYEDVDLKDETRNLRTGVIAFESRTNGIPIYMYYTPVGIYEWQMMLFVQDDVIFSSLNYLKNLLLIFGAVEVVLLLLYFSWNLRTVSILERSNTEIASQREQLKTMSYRDMLTSMYNRNKYIEITERLRGVHTDGAGVAYIDMNGLKHINDSLSHTVGDRYICTMADIIREHFPNNCYRIGGDEFVVLVQRTGNGEFSESLAALRAETERKGVSISLGSAWAEHCDDIESLLREAEREMYAEKERYYSENNTRR